MKHLITLLVGIVLLVGLNSSAYASDWDVAGKILAGIEGMRILTGGKVDIIGTMTGVNSNEPSRVTYKDRNHYTSRYQNRAQRIWVGDYVWKKKWVPQHREYDEKLGEIIVQGHYIEYKAEAGGHWEYIGKDKKHSYHRSN